jgi:subtilisin-like proprotein convertase family protein
MRPSRPLILVAATAAVSFSLTVPASAAPTAASSGGLSANAIKQIDALAQAKLGLTPTERKIDSKLLAADKIRRNVPLAAGVGRVATGVTTDKAGRTTVDIKATVSKDVLDKIGSLGGAVRDSQPRFGSIRADVPLAGLEALAATPGVSRIETANGAMTARMGDAPKPLSKAEREAQVRSRVATALGQKAAGKKVTSKSTAAVTPLVGDVTSEGDATHAAATARTRQRVSGIGVKVCVLSDGVDSLDASIASDDLPADVDVLPGEAGSGDEGTAMLEIVHDLAPKAKLGFATAFTSAESFAQNILDLRASGCDIIVDDVIYFAESPFQDGPIAQSVISVTNDGALYFSSAGNEQNVDDGTGGNWEGDFVSSGQGIGKFAGVAHDFDPGPGVQKVDPLSEDSAGVPAILQWNDALGHSGNDYDLYAVDGAGNVVAFSNDVQDGTQDAFEGFLVPFVSGGAKLAVVKFSGADRYFQITPFRGLFASGGGLTGFNTPGVTRGHSAVPAAYSVAAVPAHLAFPRAIAPGVVNPSGPFPGVYTAAQQSEVYTSDGPRHVFYNPDGSPITPGNLTSTGGTVRAKPDIAAADGTETTVPGFQPFYGTSASAPHAAAIAALVLGSNPGITPAEIRSALTSTAIDIEAPGYDRDTGFGIVMANRVLQATGATPQPFAVAGTPTVTPTTGDHDAFLEPGESASVAIPVTNEGDAAAASTRVQLTTTTPGVTITPTVQNYGRILVGATTTSAPFTLTLAPTYEAGAPVDLHIKVSFVGAYSPQARDAQAQTGQPSSTVVTAAYAGAAVPIPDNSTVGATATATVSGVGRLSRVSFSIDGTTCSATEGSTTVGLDHTFVGDLVGTLTAPNGAQVVLFANEGGAGNNFCQTVFVDSATRSIQDALNTDAPFTGEWAPEEPLNSLLGGTADGTWTFHVEDTAGVDTGSIRAFAVHVSGFVQGSGV